jgi:regulator of replication initiation timing
MVQSLSEFDALASVFRRVRRTMMNASAIADFCTKHIRDLFRQTPILKQHVRACVDENMSSIEKRLKEVEEDINKLKLQVHVLTMEKCYMEMYIKDLQQVGEPFNLPNFETLDAMMPNLTNPCPTPAMQRPPPCVARAIPIASAFDFDACPAPPRIRRGHRA